jgi:high affinity cGMP-specific 3',5'-cyclic phosphodiesterase 9
MEPLFSVKDAYKQVTTPYKIRINPTPKISMSQIKLSPLTTPENLLLNKDFPVFFYTPDQLLSCCAEILKIFNLESLKLQSFLHLISKNYFPNLPFHNFRHGFSVFQMIYVIGERNQGFENFLSREDYLFMLLSGLGHDVRHPGVNNSYLTATNHELSIEYHNKSVLENHHASVTLELLKYSNLMGEVDFHYIKEVVVSTILATDLTRHAQVEKEFKEAVAAYDKSKKNHRIAFMSYGVHCADLGNQTLEFSIAALWSLKIIQEFNQQVACEELSGITVSEFMRIGNDVEKIKKSQVGFIDFVIFPLWKVLIDTLENLEDFERELKKNREKWLEVQENYFL